MLLDTNTREFMDARFGYDFGNVREHNDDTVRISAQSVNALAYTLGNEIVFGEGQFQPHTVQG